MSNQSNNNNWKLLVGLAGGAALGWWLNTDKGREFRKNTGEKLNEFGNTVSETTQRQYANAAENVKSAIETGKEGLNNTLETGKKSLNETLEVGKTYATSIAETAKSKLNIEVNQVEDVIDEAESAFDRGARKAQATISKKAVLAQEVVSN